MRSTTRKLLLLPLLRTAAFLALLCLTSSVLAVGDQFREHLTLRPLADGRLHTQFTFILESSQLEEGVGGGEEDDSIPIYSTIPRTLIHLARASDAEEIHLAINAGRWDYEKWGQPGEEEMVGTGAEVWARLRNVGQSDAATSTIPAPLMLKWRKLTANLAGMFCASLDALDERLTVQPFSHKDKHSSTTTLHALLSSESICTENLSTLLKLLPCKTMTGLASLLKPHKFLKADFHGMSLHMKRVEEAGWKVTLNVQAVFAPVMQPYRQKRDWSLMKIFGTRLVQSCPLVHDSSITVLAPALIPSSVRGDEEEVVDFKVWPIVVEPTEEGDFDDEEDEGSKLEKKAQSFARSLRKRGKYTYDTRSSTNLNVEMTWPGEDPFSFPQKYQSPSLLASRSFSGYGQERGQIELVLHNSEAVRERMVTYFDVLPWFVKPYLHTLSTQVEADEFDEDEDNLVRFQDEITAPLLLSLDVLPSTQRQRPYHLEAKLRIPPQSTVRLSMEYDKAFLRYSEHPPDAHRGFDVAPAIVLLEDGSRIYTNPALIEVAVPDFSMPYNVIIFTSTLIALCSGSILNNLIRKYTDVLCSS
ncbi:hypothetical protein CBS101457_004564 [Exobasidium rhododendri]|nr:hypothetical protein CBS101457_004564 [Exobasidium rhododendri]